LIQEENINTNKSLLKQISSLSNIELVGLVEKLCDYECVKNSRAATINK